LPFVFEKSFDFKLKLLLSPIYLRYFQGQENPCICEEKPAAFRFGWLQIFYKPADTRGKIKKPVLPRWPHFK